MTPMPKITICDLETAECEALLARHHLGRIAFSFKDRVDIQPINYVFEGGWLSCRTEQGTKLETLHHSPWVAFEVDEAEGPYDWQSVVIRGTVYLMPEGSPDHAASVASIQRVAPQAFTDADRGAKPASGSQRTAGMVICPCSMGTLSAVAHGSSRSLIERAADVTLKEGRKLILVPRETPLSLVHLRNMTACAEAGATVIPAAPGFYHRPTRIAELVDFIVQRIVDQLGLELDIARRWEG